MTLFPKIRFHFGISIAFISAILLQGCSLAQPDKILLRIELPTRTDLAAKSSFKANPLAALTEQRASLYSVAPASLSAFNCFAINVTGPDIAPDKRMPCTDPAEVLGIVGGTIPAVGGSIELLVPAGPNRKIVLMGFDGIGECPSLETVFDAAALELSGGPSADPITKSLGTPWFLAESVVDIVGDTTVTMDVAYDPAIPKELYRSCGPQSMATPSPSPSPSPVPSTSPSPTPIDTTAPAVTLSSTVVSPTNVSTIPVTVAFNENVTGFSLSGVSVTNGTAANLTGSGASYTFDVFPSSQGSVSIHLMAGAGVDLAGNSSIASGALNLVYDSTAPGLTLSSTSPSVTNSFPIPITATFNEYVTGFDANDVTVINGTISGFAGSGNSYTFNIFPTVQGPVQVNVAAAVAQDSSGNLNTAAVTLSRTYDSVVPTVTITSTAPSSTSNSPIPITVTFNEAVTGFVSGDIAVTNASVISFSGSGSVYAFNLIPTTNGTVTVDIAAGTVMDAAGNVNTAAAQFSITFDDVSPAAPIITAPVIGQIVPSGALTVKGTCEAGATVTVSIGLAVQETCVAGTFAITVSVPSGNGTRTVTVFQSDPALNLSAGTSVSVQCLTSFKTVPQGLPGYNSLPDNIISAIFRDESVVPAILYIGTPGGLAISTDEGASFSIRTTADGLGNNGITGIAALGNKVFVGTSNGLAVSNDGGMTFTNRIAGEYIRNVALMGSTLFVATQYNGLKISTDDGLSFVTKSWSGSPTTINTVGVFGTTVLAGTSNGLAISTNSGETFVQKTLPGSNNVVSVYANATYVYAGKSDGLVMSLDSGVTYTILTNAHGLGSAYVNSVAGNGTHVYVGTENGIAVGAIGSSTFSNRTVANSLPSNLIKKVFVAGSVYAGTDNGLAISDTALSSFSNKYAINGFNSNQVLAVSGNASHLYVATSKGVSRSGDDGVTFQNVLDSPDIKDVFVSANEVYVSDYMKTWISPLLALSWVPFDWTGSLGSNQSIAAFAESNTSLYIATSTDLVFSNDDGNTVTTVMPSNPTFGGFTINSVYSGASGVFVSTSGGLYFSPDSGTTWIHVTTSNGLGSNSVNRAFVQGSTIYAATEGGLSISTDNGATFSNKSNANGLSGPVRDVAVLNNTIFVAVAGLGVGISTDGGESFVMRTAADGLSSNYPTRVHVSGSSVYVSTANGLSKF